MILGDNNVAGVLDDVDGVARVGFGTPSRRLEFFSETLKSWGWPEHAIPRYVPGHVHWRAMKREQGEFDLLPNFRLPTLIHTRSPVKWLYEISHSNPLWISTEDAKRMAIASGDLVRVQTGIGYFVTRAWVTEGIRPGIVAMSHHLGDIEVDTGRAHELYKEWMARTRPAPGPGGSPPAALVRSAASARCRSV